VVLQQEVPISFVTWRNTASRPNASPSPSTLSWCAEAASAITVTVDPDLLAWFRSQGDEFGQRINAALRIYAEAHEGLERCLQINEMIPVAAAFPASIKSGLQLGSGSRVVYY
jgi:uncharacterized protein (DUF4415 family)